MIRSHSSAPRTSTWDHGNDFGFPNDQTYEWPHLFCFVWTLAMLRKSSLPVVRCDSPAVCVLSFSFLPAAAVQVWSQRENPFLIQQMMLPFPAVHTMISMLQHSTADPYESLKLSLTTLLYVELFKLKYILSINNGKYLIILEYMQLVNERKSHCFVMKQGCKLINTLDHFTLH